MLSDPIQIEYLPDLEEPLLIAGFEGWGNALDISRGMIEYLIGKLKAQVFGKIDSDLFYRFDENRPLVNIQDGLLKDLSPPGTSPRWSRRVGRLERACVCHGPRGSCLFVPLGFEWCGASSASSLRRKRRFYKIHPPERHSRPIGPTSGYGYQAWETV